jgi:hypothetical protein
MPAPEILVIPWTVADSLKEVNTLPAVSFATTSSVKSTPVRMTGGVFNSRVTACGGTCAMRGEIVTRRRMKRGSVRLKQAPFEKCGKR